MKRILNIIMMAGMLSIISCTTRKEPMSIDITGTWELVNMEETKGIQIGETTVSVEITFNSDKTFSITQTLGEGRSEKFAGTWQLTGNILTGKYSDGKALGGGSYNISMENSTLTMIPESGKEIYTYKKK